MLQKYLITVMSPSGTKVLLSSNRIVSFVSKLRPYSATNIILVFYYIGIFVIYLQSTNTTITFNRYS